MNLLEELVPGLPLAPGNYSVSISPKSIRIRRLGKPRRVHRIGDQKTVRGKTYVYRQRYSRLDRAHLVRRGRPIMEWRREDLHLLDRQNGDYP